MQKLIDHSWWKDVTTATTGTIIGIIVTFGTTAYLEHKTQKEMSGKTVLMTIHNIDASIKNMRNLVGEMQSNDSLYCRAMSLMPDNLCAMGTDSLQMVVSKFCSSRFYTTDNSTRQIFSSSFEVWQNLDDTKVISRIGNCYSMLDVCYKLYDKAEKLRLDAYKMYWNDMPPQDYADTQEAVKAFLKRNDVRYALEVHGYTTEALVSMTNLILQLNDRNKEVLDITQEELDEVGNLLDKNEYFTEKDFNNKKE